MRNKILVTGGTGFIGSYLTEELRKLNYDIKILTQERLKGRQYIPGDIRDEDLDLKGYNVIYHLAALSNPGFCEDNKGLAWDVNVNGTLNLLEKLEKGQKIIFTSSAHVYGGSSNPHSEDEPLNPPDFYGLTKKTAEELIEYCSEKKGFAYTILRFFNIYGPKQSKGFLIPDIIEKYRAGGEIKIINPEAKRDFVYISDAVVALVEAINARGIYNIGSGRGTRIEDIYSLIKKEICTKNVIENVIKRNEDALIADATKAEKELGWKPKVGLREGIRKTIESMP
ncbi:MAG: NAD(P)-dependent oxidoreductase [Candidatus Hydrothermarchaeota archaeon]|nr:NAD(P)-dependent oxidoreductase [Candidatus Hydrothermarchaeota archaeon]